MIAEAATERRALRTVRMTFDLVVAGGGMAGVCCAIMAARTGLRVALVQDRPVLGGNASSEIRLWIASATSHYRNNNRWAREGGVIDEILLENAFRNPAGNPYVFDALLLDWVSGEANITLLLNTAIYDLEKSAADRIQLVRGFCRQNETHYELTAPLFCDATGDGMLGFLAGAAFRMGSEAQSEFDEGCAPRHASPHTMGDSILFYTKDAGKPTTYFPPRFAMLDVESFVKYRKIDVQAQGSQLWWIEFGGQMDTVYDTEAIKWELWRIVYGVWNHIKNSGRFPEADTLTLDWVGHLPGKRESRRFEGGYLLKQQDLVEQRRFEDAVTYGGWFIDIHPSEGLYSPDLGKHNWHLKGLYQIPYACLYSRNISNLFLAGRSISATHVAFSAIRVMATLAHAAQAVGMAASLCHKHQMDPQDLRQAEWIGKLQLALIRRGHFIPHLHLKDPDDLAQTAQMYASSELRLGALPANGPTISLHKSTGQWLPLNAGRVPRLGLEVHASGVTTLTAELRTSSRPENFTPDVTLAQQQIAVRPGYNQTIEIDFDYTLEQPCYVLLCLLSNDAVQVCTSQQRVTGLTAVRHRGDQKPPNDLGIDAFELWAPDRHLVGTHNLALTFDPPVTGFGVENLVSGYTRPEITANAWVAELDDSEPCFSLQWDEPQHVAEIHLTFDTDRDHPLETLLVQHPENRVPQCIPDVRIEDGAGQTLHTIRGNYQTRQVVRFDRPIRTQHLSFFLQQPRSHVAAALYEVRCYGQHMT
jgi:hypothetical protein